jgi:hypothetical protein
MKSSCAGNSARTALRRALALVAAVAAWSLVPAGVQAADRHGVDSFAALAQAHDELLNIDGPGRGSWLPQSADWSAGSGAGGGAESFGSGARQLIGRQDFSVDHLRRGGDLDDDGWLRHHRFCDDCRIPVHPVPEPGSAGLLVAGLVALLAVLRLRRRRGTIG